MSKFKVGDNVKCIEHGILDTTYGNVYKVLAVSEFWGKLYFDYIDDVGERSDRLQSRFELVQEDVVLTPEEVFAHLRKGTELEVFGRYETRKGSFEKWLDAPPIDLITYNTIVTKQWRVKPEPEIIELNGKKYREIVE